MLPFLVTFADGEVMGLADGRDFGDVERRAREARARRTGGRCLTRIRHIECMDCDGQDRRPVVVAPVAGSREEQAVLWKDRKGGQD